MAELKATELLIKSREDERELSTAQEHADEACMFRAFMKVLDEIRDPVYEFTKVEPQIEPL